MRRKTRLVLLGTLAAVVAIGLMAVTASAKPAKKAAVADACVLLPDTKSSIRWESFDRPALTAAFKAAGVSFTILNAEGGAQQQRSQADQCLTNGAKVILLVNLDSGSGAAIQKAAAAKGAKSIDYDRLTLNGLASYYVSFDGVAVGKLQGAGVVAGLKANGMYSKKPVVAELNGSPTDNNATLFKRGYDSVLNPLYKNGTFKKGPDQWVPAWDNQKALTIFEQMLAKTGNKIDAVAAANDGLANAVVSALKNQKLKPIPLSGQDATPQGVQNILAGWQSMTVYKAVPKQAAAAAQAVIGLLKGTPVKTNGVVNNGSKKVPAILIQPTSITKANYKVLFTDKFLKKSEVCVGEYAKYCK